MSTMSGLSSAAPQQSPLLDASVALLREPERALLTRLALLTSFDDQIAAEVSRSIDPGRALAPENLKALENLKKYPFVLKVRGKPVRYRIRDDMRRALLDTWRAGQPSGTVPADVATSCGELAKQLEMAGADAAEVLGLRLAADPERALDQWKSLYANADKRFNLVRCQFLISMLGWMAAISARGRRGPRRL